MYVTSANPVSKPTDVVASADALGVTKRMSSLEAETQERDDTECPTCGREDFKNLSGMKQHHAITHGESLSGVKYDCDGCGETFRLPKHRLEKYENNYCSTSCNSNRTVVSCAVCGAEFDIVSSRAEQADRHFCSDDCEREWRTEYFSKNSPTYNSEEVPCDSCGETLSLSQSQIDEHNFCDIDCYGQWISENRCGENSPSYNKLDVDCDYCGSTVKKPPSRVARSKRNFCDQSCFGKWFSENRSGENSHEWEGGAVGYGRGWNDQKRKAVRERDGHKCVSCGMVEKKHKEKYGRLLDVHHLIKARNIDDPDERNAVENLVTLCIDCHQRWERLSEADIRPQIDGVTAD